MILIYPYDLQLFCQVKFNQQLVGKYILAHLSSLAMFVLCSEARNYVQPEQKTYVTDMLG